MLPYPTQILSYKQQIDDLSTICIVFGFLSALTVHLNLNSTLCVLHKIVLWILKMNTSYFLTAILTFIVATLLVCSSRHLSHNAGGTLPYTHCLHSLTSLLWWTFTTANTPSGPSESRRRPTSGKMSRPECMDGGDCRKNLTPVWVLLPLSSYMEWINQQLGVWGQRKKIGVSVWYKRWKCYFSSLLCN